MPRVDSKTLPVGSKYFKVSIQTIERIGGRPPSYERVFTNMGEWDDLEEAKREALPKIRSISRVYIDAMEVRANGRTGVPVWVGYGEFQV